MHDTVLYEYYRVEARVDSVLTEMFSPLGNMEQSSAMGSGKEDYISNRVIIHSRTTSLFPILSAHPRPG